MGGLGAYIWAHSSEAVEARFDVQVVNELPAWLKGHEPGVVSLDIDDAPPDWLPLR